MSRIGNPIVSLESMRPSQSGSQTNTTTGNGSTTSSTNTNTSANTNASTNTNTSTNTGVPSKHPEVAAIQSAVANLNWGDIEQLLAGGASTKPGEHQGIMAGGCVMPGPEGPIEINTPEQAKLNELVELLTNLAAKLESLFPKPDGVSDKFETHGKKPDFRGFLDTMEVAPQAQSFVPPTSGIAAE